MPVAPPIVHPIDKKNVLSELDLTQKLSQADYETSWPGTRPVCRTWCAIRASSASVALVLVSKADAAGRAAASVASGGDGRPAVPDRADCRAPTEEERAQPYLWRFWRHLPRTGRAAIFDRSWYDRVLVERSKVSVPERRLAAGLCRDQ